MVSSRREHVQDAEEEGGSDEDEDGFNDNLNKLLREYRQQKQAREAALQHRAMQDGRPFSAPASSPSCASIRKRMAQDDLHVNGRAPGAAGSADEQCCFVVCVRGGSATMHAPCDGFTSLYFPPLGRTELPFAVVQSSTPCFGQTDADWCFRSVRSQAASHVQSHASECCTDRRRCRLACLLDRHSATGAPLSQSTRPCVGCRGRYRGYRWCQRSRRRGATAAACWDPQTG